MRIIAGELRSRRIRTPAGDATRPTTDRSRESVFNILSHLRDLSGLRVLDLFAGSGALAFEALSRGAAHATLVERNPKALAAISENSRTLKLESRINLCSADVYSYLKRSPALPFDLVFSDAPYADAESLRRVAELIFANKFLAQDGLCIIEHSSAKTITVPPEAVLQRELKVGEAAFSFLMFRTELIDEV